MENRIQEAMNVFHNYTCITWIPKRPEDKAFATFTFDGAECSSTAGYQGLRNHNVYLPSIICFSRTTLLHEMLHLLGFMHEQNRKDRDQYMDMFYHNMATVNDEYDIYEDSAALNFPYDYLSSLHYRLPGIGGSRGDRLSMMPKSNPCLRVGQGRGMSKLDVTKINNYYDCSTHPGISEEFTGTDINPYIPLPWEGPMPEELYKQFYSKYHLRIEWIDGTTKFQCFMEDQIAVPKPIGCVEQQTNTTYSNGDEFLIGENKCRCEFSKAEAKILILNGCENFKHEEWIAGRYVFNYQCDSKENKLVHKIVGCTSPVNSNGPKFVRNGEEIESSNSYDKYFCSIYANGTRARNEKRQ